MIENLNKFIDEQSGKDTLRFIICGSVDDGKSTLIGRLLYEAKLIYEDQIETFLQDSKHMASKENGLDFALLVDGLAAEREQSITIDVAYRYFATKRRKFIVSDTPGHEQYTRNMVTGASMADIAVVLIDAAQGLTPQSRRHTLICALLGIKHVAVIVNKMDLIAFRQKDFENIVSEFNNFAGKFDFLTITSIPVSALHGDNVVTLSSNMDWYSDKTFIEYLESIQKIDVVESEDFSMPVQWVNRANPNFRGYSGTITSGFVSVGDRIEIMPSGQKTKIKEVVRYNDSKNHAIKGESVTLLFDKEIDCSRGAIIVKEDSSISQANIFQAKIVWLDNEAGYQGRAYRIKTHVIECDARLSEIKYKYDINTLSHLPSKKFDSNDIGVVTISTDREVPFKPYCENKELGSFILIDRYTNATVAAGMIDFPLRRGRNINFQNLEINRASREALNRHKARVIWFTGLSGSGKSTLANALEKHLFNLGYSTYILDGDNIRKGLNGDLGFTSADRVENVRRVSEVAKLMVDAGLIVIVSLISPYKAERDSARKLFCKDEFIEIYLDIELQEAEERDVKGLYKKARNGAIPNFTGIDSHYEPPEKPDLHLKTGGESVEQSIQKITDFLHSRVH